MRLDRHTSGRGWSLGPRTSSHVSLVTVSHDDRVTPHVPFLIPACQHPERPTPELQRHPNQAGQVQALETESRWLGVVAKWVALQAAGISPPRRKGEGMVALFVLLLILAVFGGFGFAAHVLWFVLIAAVVLWLLGFLVGGVSAGVGRRRWYGRW